MRNLVIVAAALALAACGGKGTDGNASAASGASSAPVKHQPGSWTNKITITSLDAGPGVDTTKIKQGLQQMFDALGTKGICITPELAAKDNPAANMERLAAQGKKCDFDRKIADGSRLDYAGTCTDANGTKVHVAIAGTNGATEQDLTVKSEPVDPTGKTKGSMEMRIVSQRTGECKPGDITPPAPGATS